MSSKDFHVIVADLWQKPKFLLGSVVITINAATQLDLQDVQEGLRRHQAGDWGELTDDDAQENESSLANGWRLFSAYTARRRPMPLKFWIITEADRSVTTVLLPEDY
jgi:hypothetical protein